jgi:hypothetical protein
MPNPRAAACECTAVCSVLIDRKDPKPDPTFNKEHNLHLREVRLFNSAGAQISPDKLGAQQSSTSANFTALLCIDGQAHTLAEPGYDWNMCSTADGDPSPWLRVTYPCAEGLSNVEVYNRVDCCGERITAFKLRLLDSTNTTAGVPYEFDNVQNMYTIEAGDVSLAILLQWSDAPNVMLAG